MSPVGKTGSEPVGGSRKGGPFQPIKLMGANGLSRRAARPGQTVGHYVKLISLSPDSELQAARDLTRARDRATATRACDALPAGGAGEDRLEKYIADNLLPWAAADFAPREAGVVPEETYIEHGRDLERAYSLQVINFILGTLQPDTDLAMVGYPFTDEVSHQFMGLVSPTDGSGNPNPCYDYNPKFDDVTCTGAGTAHRVAIREDFIRSAYVDADEKLGVTRALMGGNPTTFAGLRPRLRTAVVRDQREQGPELGDGAQHRHEPRCLAAREQRERSELRRGDHGSDQGLLGRRDDPGLRQLDAARRDHVTPRCEPRSAMRSRA